MQSKEFLYFLDHPVDVIRKPRRRSLTLTMHPDRPLKVLTNTSTSPKQILEFLLRKKKWIEKNLKQFSELKEKFKQPKFEEGEKFPFLGELKYLHFSITPRKDPFFHVEDGYLICYLPRGKGASDFVERELQRRLSVYYQREAAKYLKERVETLAKTLGLHPSAISFRAQRTRWGSCTSQGRISLNWKMICQSPSLIDYVIIHELCHLKHMNHSKDFWSLVESFFPSYMVAEEILKSHERLGHFLEL